VSPPTPIDRAIAAVPMLSAMSGRQLKRLSANATTRSYAAGSIIIREGDTSMAMYVLLEGSARVECTGPDGQPVVLATLQPDDFFGEMGLIDDTTRCTSVIAVQDTRCVLIDKWDFERRLAADAEIALALVRILNARVRELTAQVAACERERSPLAPG
jgi:CRP/FNR family cyclic AMP-dependent transcriptional regulator